MVVSDDVKAIVSAGYVEHVRDVVMSKKLLEDEIAELESQLGLKGSGGSERVRTSPSADALPDGLARLEALKAEFETEMVSYTEHYGDFHRAAAHIDVRPRAALTYHYIHLITWEEVCVKMGYSYEGIMRIRKRGLIQLYDYIPVEHRDVLPRAL